MVRASEALLAQVNLFPALPALNCTDVLRDGEVFLAENVAATQRGWYRSTTGDQVLYFDHGCTYIIMCTYNYIVSRARWP